MERGFRASFPPVSRSCGRGTALAKHHSLLTGHMTSCWDHLRSRNRRPEMAASPARAGAVRSQFCRAPTDGPDRDRGAGAAVPAMKYVRLLRGPRKAGAAPNRRTAAISKTLSVRPGLCDYLDAVALMDKTPPCSIIEPDPESGAVGHPLFQDTAKRRPAAALQTHVASGRDSCRPCGQHHASLDGFDIIGGAGVVGRARTTCRKSLSFCQQLVLHRDRSGPEMQASPPALPSATCQFKDAEWMRRRNPRRDGHRFRPEWIGGTLRAEQKQNIKQLMDEQFVHESG
jgi:hypothetical protein